MKRRRELSAEIQAHIEEKAAELIEAGVPQQEARNRARREFGNATLVAETSNEVWGWSWLDRLGQDLRYALRQMRRSPAFTAIAVLSLALGIGANTAIFTVIDALLLRSLPVKEPDRLVSLAMPFINGFMDTFPYPMAGQLRDRIPEFSDLSTICLVDRSNIAVGGPGGTIGDPDPGQVKLGLVSGNYFRMLGVEALIGRTFTPEEDRVPGGHPLAVISYGYWERRFALAGDIVGRTFRLNNTIYTILGVTPRGFSGEAVGNPTDIWVPITMQAQAMPDNRPNLLANPNAPWVRVVARLKPGTTLAQTRTDAGGAFFEIIRERPGSRNITREQVGSLSVEPAARGYSWQRQALREPLQVLMIVVGVVLLIACANVANLLLARSAAREREIAVRLSLGAGKWRLIRQLLTESLLLALLAGAAGFFLAQWGTALVARLVASGQSAVTLDLHPDARLLGFTAALSLLTGLLFGLAPAIQASATSPSPSLKGETPGIPRRFAAGKLLVVLQVALSLTLVIGAGLFTATLRNLKSQDLGFDRQNVLMVWTAPSHAGRKGAELGDLFRSAQERISSLPGVLAAGVSSFGLLNGGGGSPVTVPGYVPKPDEDRFVAWNLITPRFFDSVGMKLIAGRDFTERDDQAAPDVAVINESMALKYFGRPDPIGRSFGMRGGAEGSEIEIVGVVRDAKYGSLREQGASMIYLPYHQDLFHLTSLCVSVRTVGGLPALGNSIRAELRNLDANLPVLSIDTMEQDVDKTLAQERLIAWISGFFGALAALLASLGLYGVMSHVAARRTSEIGVRVALGATRFDVLSMVLGESLVLVAAGVALGALGAALATRGVSKLLFGLKPTDPVTFAGAAALMIAVAVAAAFLPARRASRVDPMVALRHD